MPVRSVAASKDPPDASYDASPALTTTKPPWYDQSLARALQPVPRSATQPKLSYRYDQSAAIRLQNAMPNQQFGKNAMLPNRHKVRSEKSS